MTCVRISIVDAHDLTRAGLTHLLNWESNNRYAVVPLDEHGRSPDAVLYSLDHENPEDHDAELHVLLRDTTGTIIATYWDDTSPAIEAAQACGVHGTLSLKLPAEELLAGIEQDPREPGPPQGSCLPRVRATQRSSGPGSPLRELDVLRLVGAGLTNQEIADTLYLSINSVKTYIRTAYQKIGAHRRPQAVVWAERHGLTSRQPGTPTPGDNVSAE